jgi:hypothetical protein
MISKRSIINKRSGKKYKPHFSQRKATMKKFIVVTLAMILTLSAFSLQVPPAYAIGAPPPPTRVLTALLSGPAIEGVVPSAKANFQATLGDTSLAVGASNLNLPDFTVLTVSLNGTDVLQLTVIGGQAGRILSPSPVVHVGELITISAGGSIILSGTFKDPSNL